jgi:hypothetical protein
MGCLEPRWEPPSVGTAGNGYSAVEKFLEDLGKDGDVCRRQAVDSMYGRFARFVCGGDVDAVADVPWSGAVAFATYYLIFHKRDLETARRALELLKFRNLNDEEEAMLKILELAYAAAANPPCGDSKALSQYVEKVEDVPEPTERVELLKSLVLAHLTEVDVEMFKKKIEETCRTATCSTASFYYFAFYIVDKIRPLCPQAQKRDGRKYTFDECLDEGRNFRKVVEAALVPVATATFVLLFYKLLPFFVLSTVFYILWTFYMYTKYSKDVPVCVRRVWNSAGWAVAAGNVFVLAAFTYILATASGGWNLADLILAVSALVGMSFAWLNAFTVYALVVPSKPHGVDFPRTGARDEHREYRRFLEDLVDALNVQDMCNGWLPFEHYNKMRALVCRGDLEAAGKVSEGWPLIFVAYYLMFHSRDLEMAQKVLNLLKSRDLDEKEKAALEILEAAGEVAASPPCGNPEALRRYAEKIHSVQTYGWASVLKALVTTHLTCGPDYKDDVKLALLWAAKRCGCDNPSICYFAYRLLNRIKPLCSCPV